MTDQHHDEFEQFAAVVTSRLGFHVHPHNKEQVELAMRHGLARTGCRSVAQYVARFGNEAFAQKELCEIALELTVSETYFFRHSEQFQAFVEVAIPERIRAKAAIRTLTVLSAGCASGEEAYSLSAAMADIPELRGWDIRVWGIDVNPHLVEAARRGRYSAWSLRGVSDGKRRQHFHLDGDVYVLDAKLKATVHFEPRNLLDEDSHFWRPEFFDVIFCRNVMIYFSSVAVRAVVDRLTRSLVPGGFLFLGPSETLRGISQEFHLRHTHGAFYYQRRGPNEPMLPALQGVSTQPLQTLVDPPDMDKQAWASAIAGASDRIAALADQAGRGTPAKGPPHIPSKPNEAVFPAAKDLDEVRDFLRQERFNDALKAIHSLPQAAAGDSDTLLLQAVVLASMGDLSHAEQLCSQLLARDEMRPGAHYLMALCQERRGDLLSAAEHDQMAIYLEPPFAMPHLHLGLLAKRMGDMATARRELGEAIVLLEQEDASRILLFGGGFAREALVRFCQTVLDSTSGPSKGGDNR